MNHDFPMIYLLPKTKKFKSVFYCYVHQLTCHLKPNIYALFERLKQFFSCFYCSIFDAPFCHLVE